MFEICSISRCVLLLFENKSWSNIFHMKATLIYMKINELNLKTHLDVEILHQQSF